MRIPIETQAREGQRVKRAVLAKEQTIIPARSTMKVLIQIRGKSSLPTDRDFLINSAKTDMGAGRGVSASVIDANTAGLIIRNTSNRSVTVGRKQRLGTAEEYFDASSKGFGVMIYHVTKWDHENTTPIPREKVKPILFLSKILITAGDPPLGCGGKRPSDGERSVDCGSELSDDGDGKALADREWTMGGVAGCAMPLLGSGEPLDHSTSFCDTLCDI